MIVILTSLYNKSIAHWCFHNLTSSHQSCLILVMLSSTFVDLAPIMQNNLSFLLLLWIYWCYFFPSASEDASWSHLTGEGLFFKSLWNFTFLKNISTLKGRAKLSLWYFQTTLYSPLIKQFAQCIILFFFNTYNSV